MPTPLDRRPLRLAALLVLATVPASAQTATPSRIVTKPRPVTAAPPGGQATPAVPTPVPPSRGTLETPSTAVAHPDKAPIQVIATVGHRLLAGGRDGLMILSDDDGITWRQVQLPVSATLTGIAFSDDHVGWAVGHSGLVLRSEDAGEHWALIYDGARAARATLEAAQFANASDAVRQKKIATAQALIDQDPSRPFLLIQTAGANTVRLIGSDNLSIESQDGGYRWVPWSDGIDNAAGLQAYGLAERGAIALVDGEHGLLLAGRPEDGLHALKPPYDGTLFGAVDGGSYGFVIFGERGRAYCSGDQAVDKAPGQTIAWHRIDNPSPTTLSAGLRRQDGSVLLGDTSGATWLLQGQPSDAHLVPVRAQAPFPILALVETAGRALLLGGNGGIVRVATP